MRVEIRRLGLTGLLVDCGSAQARRAYAAALAGRLAELPAVLEVVPAACTVAVFLESQHRMAPVRAALLELAGSMVSSPGLEATTAPLTAAGIDLVVPVTYDGADLDEVSHLLGLTLAELVAWHTGQVWTCDVTGFLPGFAYLVGEDPREVPRRSSPRPRIPAGSVALAAAWTGIYPGESPGGWQLIGRTSLVMFDPARPRPALLEQGLRLRFEARP